MRILSFGSLNLDYVYRVLRFVRPGETLAALGREVVCGGKGLNQSVALSRAGGEVWHAGCVGRADGKPLVDFLETCGVRTELIEVKDVPSGHTVIQVEDSGANSILLFGGANRTVSPEQIASTIEGFEKGDIIVLQNEINALDTIMRLAKEKGLRIAVNPSPVAGARTLPLELAEWIFVNEDEARALAGLPDREHNGDRDAPDETAARSLSKIFTDSRIIMTCGSRGALAAGGGGETLFEPARRVTAIDTTAAGDTFLGYYLGSIAAGLDEKECLKRAAAAAAISVQRRGAAPSVPALSEVSEALPREKRA